MRFSKICRTPLTAHLPLLLTACTLVYAGCSGNASTDPRTPTSQKASPNVADTSEWRNLFDGSTFSGWRGLGREATPEAHWIIEDGMLRKVASGTVPVQADGQPLEGGDLMTIDTFRDFELYFEWKVSPAGNSGIKYNVSEDLSTANPPQHAALGFEYQVLDDDRHPDGELETHRAGALYDMIAAGPAKRLRPVGEFNSGRIIFRGGHGEHWLNGAKVVEYDLQSARFDSVLATSKYAAIPGFADRRDGHIVLQDHGDDVWFRNIRIREFRLP